MNSIPEGMNDYVLMKEKDFLPALDTIKKHIVEKYGISIVLKNLGVLFTATFTGDEIQWDYRSSPEATLFGIVHVFGHNVQWLTDLKMREIGKIVFPKNLTPEMAESMKEYEKNASCIGLQLMHDAGIYDLDQWLTDYFSADSKYLHWLYKHGKPLEDFDPASLGKLLKERFMTFGVTPLLKPMKIPEFEVNQLEDVRGAF